MRTDNIAVSFTVTFPYGQRRDLNHIGYSREAILSALSSAEDIPIIDYAEDIQIIERNGSFPRIVGKTDGVPYAIQDDVEKHEIRCTFDGRIFFGGIECRVNTQDADGTITNFDIISFGIPT